jgi:acetyl-CoA synthetase
LHVEKWLNIIFGCTLYLAHYIDRSNLFVGVRGNKRISLRKTVNEALKNNNCPSIKNIFVVNRTDAKEDIQPNDIMLEQEMGKCSTKCEPEIMNSEDVLFILYTSGSTGTPKGVAHSTAGYLLYAAFTQKYVFGYEDNTDIFGCVADIGMQF